MMGSIDRPIRRAAGLHGLWRSHVVALAAACAAILLIFARDAADMAAIWWESSTYNHILLIPPIIGWLVWQRWDELRTIAPRAWLPGLALVGLGGSGWLLGQAAGVGFARHLGLVLMLQGAVVAILGENVARGLMFPLGYALFLVPFGEELVPPLQTLTAQMCMGLLGLVGVPAHIEGVFITIPNGYFEVAEACSGVKFLVAMLAYGALVANVCFRSWPRRIAFMAVAVVVPVLANGVRAWGTIYIAHLTTADFAAGFDHVVYGGIFFAIVMAAVMAAGWKFFDRRLNDPWIADVPKGAAEADPRRLIGIALAAVALAAMPPVWTGLVAHGGAELPDRMMLPEVPGWKRVSMETGHPWRPHFANVDHALIGRYRDARGRSVDLALAFYERQEEGRELVGFGQGALGPESDWAWTEDRPAPPQGRAMMITAPGPVRREVVTFYRVGDLVTGSETRVKLETLRARLLGGDQRAAAILVSAPEPGGRAAIDAFLRALGPVDRMAERAMAL